MNEGWIILVLYNNYRHVVRNCFHVNEHHQGKHISSHLWCVGVYQVSFTPNGVDMRMLQPCSAPLRRHFLPAVKVEYSMSSRQSSYRVQIHRIQVRNVTWNTSHLREYMNRFSLSTMRDGSFTSQGFKCLSSLLTDPESAPRSHLPLCFLPCKTTEINHHGLRSLSGITFNCQVFAFVFIVIAVFPPQNPSLLLTSALLPEQQDTLTSLELSKNTFVECCSLSFYFILGNKSSLLTLTTTQMSVPGISWCWFKRWTWSWILASSMLSWTCSHPRMPAPWAQNRRLADIWVFWFLEYLCYNNVNFIHVIEIYWGFCASVGGAVSERFGKHKDRTQQCFFRWQLSNQPLWVFSHFPHQGLSRLQREREFCSQEQEFCCSAMSLTVQLHLSFSLSTGGEDGMKQERETELIPVQSLNLLLKSIGATLTDVQDVVFK